MHQDMYYRRNKCRLAILARKENERLAVPAQPRRLRLPAEQVGYDGTLPPFKLERLTGQLALDVLNTGLDELYTERGPVGVEVESLSLRERVVTRQARQRLAPLGANLSST